MQKAEKKLFITTNYYISYRSKGEENLIRNSFLVYIVRMCTYVCVCVCMFNS